ncbi:hypothetical protein HDF25_001146 [Pedobacter cryoconitis]|uniref:Uncharacterized protein n=1 Tax=Pedobacter cryoconitis TaxID=188932 RepID=A0A7X0J150_9SPHI|nr:hypothetical protein [Pedobacter cryoconitis]
MEPVSYTKRPSDGRFLTEESTSLHGAKLLFTEIIPKFFRTHVKVTLENPDKIRRKDEIMLLLPSHFFESPLCTQCCLLKRTMLK